MLSHNTRAFPQHVAPNSTSTFDQPLTEQQCTCSDMTSLKRILMLCSDETPTTELHAISSCGQSHY
jgi:hypothetical protein